MGLLVDAVSEVLDIKEREIQDAPAFGGNVNTDFILGIGKVRDEVKILLDIEKVITNMDITIPDTAERAGKNNQIDKEAELQVMSALMM
jgi:chemotaxis signal transduction protein